MPNLDRRLSALEQKARPNGYCVIVVYDGEDCDESERDEDILERKLREAGISRQEFDAVDGKFLRVRWVEPKPR